MKPMFDCFECSQMAGYDIVYSFACMLAGHRHWGMLVGEEEE